MPSSSSASYRGRRDRVAAVRHRPLAPVSRAMHVRASRSASRSSSARKSARPDRWRASRAAERLVVGLLAGGHLHQRRPAEEHLGPVLDEDRVVGHARDVRAAGGRVAEDHRDRRDPGRREPGQVAERRGRRDEDLRLVRQVGAAGLDQVHHRQPVGQGDLAGALGLLQRVRVDRAAPDGRVVGDDHARHALDHADPGDHAGADREVGAVRRPPA